MNENNHSSVLTNPKLPLFFAAAVFFAQLITLMTLSLDGLRAYGDQIHFYLSSGLSGWPYLNYWSEYPPIFPFLVTCLNRLAGNQEHIFYYLLLFVILLANTGCMYFFTRLALRLFFHEQAALRGVAYLVVLISLAYTRMYIDPLPVFFMLLGLTLILEGRNLRAGAALAVGISMKFFPGLALLAAWKRRSRKQTAVLLAVSLVPLMLLYSLLWSASPDFTSASIRSQGSKGSWETVWALIDGNIRTGSFGSLEDRLDPAKALVSPGNPAVIPSWASLLGFGALGLLGLWKAGALDADPAVRDRQSLARVGFAWGLFLLWSPGWSPQWVLYLLPLILLALPGRQAVLLSVVMIMVNLLEWPVMLSRGFFSALWLTIPLRTLLLLIMAGAFFEAMRAARTEQAGKVERPEAASPRGMV